MECIFCSWNKEKKREKIITYSLILRVPYAIDMLKSECKLSKGVVFYNENEFMNSFKHVFNEKFSRNLEKLASSVTMNIAVFSQIPFPVLRLKTPDTVCQKLLYKLLSARC